MRAWVTVATLVWIATATAQAGDGAATHVLGFSADGRYFAFEQYARDARGAAFSEILTVEVRDDREAEAPIRESFTPPPAGAVAKAAMLPTLPDIRARVAARAAPTLKRLGIDTPARLVGTIPTAQAADMLGGVSGAPAQAAAHDVLVVDLGGTAGRLRLRSFDLETRRCEQGAALPTGAAKMVPKGMAVVLERPGRTPLTLSQDRMLPPARGCPERYGLVAAYSQPRPDGSTALAVLIQYFYAATEGPDRRFFVVAAAVR